LENMPRSFLNIWGVILTGVVPTPTGEKMGRK